MKKDTVRRLPPCDVLDIERTESWLSDMAAQGLHLKETYNQFYEFKRGEPKTVRYRLEPIGKNEFDQKMALMDLCHASGWGYVTKHRGFWIFRTEDPNAPEMNTEPALYAVAVKRLLWRKIWGWLIDLVCICLLGWLYYQDLFRYMVVVGFLPILVVAVGLVCGLVDIVVQVVRLIQQYRKLKAHVPLEHNKPWRRSARLHRFGSICCIAMLILIHLNMGGRLLEVLQSSHALSEYEGDPPFVTMEDLVPGSEVTWKSLYDYNQYTLVSTVAAPVNLQWEEYGELVTPEGEVYSGTMRVSYHKTAAEWIAKGLTEQYIREFKENGYTILEEYSTEDGEYVLKYISAGVVMVLIRQETTVIQGWCDVVNKAEENLFDTWLDLTLERLGSEG